MADQSWLIDFSALQQFDWPAVEAVGSIAIALIGGFAAYWFRISARRREALTAYDGYRRELIAYASAVILAIDDARGLTLSDPAKAGLAEGAAGERFFQVRADLLARLSSQIDIGRFHFPTHEPSVFGATDGQPAPVRRDRVLDRVVSAHACLMAVDYRDFAKNREPIALAALVRRFVADGDAVGGRDRHLIAAFRHLPDIEQQRLLEIDAHGKLTLDDLLVAAKRSFVRDVNGLIQPRDFLRSVESAFGFQFRWHTPGRPGIKVELPPRPEAPDA